MTFLQSQLILVQPNQFQLKGYDIEISYETTSFTGTPRFSVTRQGQTLNFSGEEIQSELTQLGQMATVNLSENLNFVSESLIATGFVETLTLLIPTIKVLSTTRTAPIQTTAIFNRQSLQVTTGGQSQRYLTICLSGIANQLDF